LINSMKEPRTANDWAQYRSKKCLLGRRWKKIL
jgi:hypothetical protein